MAETAKLSYTASQIDQLLGKIDGIDNDKVASIDDLNNRVTTLENETAPNSNIINGEGEASLHQSLDAKYSGIATVTKNPNAAALDPTLTDNEPMGATGDWATSLGGNSSAQGKRSVAEGTSTVAKGSYSHVEGSNSVALGACAHAEGGSTVALGTNSHSEGNATQAVKDQTHAEGDQTIAAGYAAHAGGILSQANGDASFVSGSRVIANNYAQAVVGKWNDPQDDTLFEVGCGYEGNRRNAFAAGDVNGESFLSIGSTKLTENELAALKNGGGAFGDFVESTEYPGCYYREVTTTVTHGTITEKEWLNPPMVSGKVYRTTKRSLGQPVYAMYANIGILAVGSTKSVNIDTNSIATVGGNEYALIFNTGRGCVESHTFYCYEMDTGVNMWDGVRSFCYMNGTGITAGLTTPASFDDGNLPNAYVYVEAQAYWQ